MNVKGSFRIQKGFSKSLYLRTVHGSLFTEFKGGHKGIDDRNPMNFSSFSILVPFVTVTQVLEKLERILGEECLNLFIQRLEWTQENG